VRCLRETGKARTGGDHWGFGISVVEPSGSVSVIDAVPLIRQRKKLI
jgi:hypothetical protein